MTTEELHWDPYDTSFAADPYPVWNRMREEAPLYYNEPHDFYAVSRYADVERVLTDTETYSSARGVMLELIKLNMEIPPGTLIMEDPPIHNIHRQLLARVFSPRRIAELEPLVRAYCTDCLDPLVGETRFDLIEKLGLEMPMKVIGMLLGIPEEGQVAFRNESNAKILTEDGGKIDFSEEVVLTHEAMGDYIDWRYAHPSDDVMTELIKAEFVDENGVTRTLTRDEVLMYVTVLAGAGNETTGRLIGWMGSTLARHPQQRAELAADLSLVPGAVEEVLRLRSIVPGMSRVVVEACEHRGLERNPGDRVAVSFTTANLDPAVFADPRRFIIDRPEAADHMTFGWGPHLCPGAPLARLELQEALRALVTRFGPPLLDDGPAVPDLPGSPAADTLMITFPPR